MAAPLFIVGVGASAGGLEALGSLVQHLTLDQMALVVVQHLAPTHQSALPALLSRSTPIEVSTATNGQKVESNHVYVIPPNADLQIHQGVLQVISPPALATPRLPIDSFFRSLAEDQGDKAIGVILSGTGSDGTLGCKAIKEAGGLAFAQDPESAKYDGMPRAAIASDCVDFTGVPQALADELMALGTHPYHAEAAHHEPPAADLTKLLTLIRTQFGADFSEYKLSTIQRRTERRMALHRITRMEDYLKLAASDAAELHALQKDMLIGVTNFFRDHDPFEALRTKVFPSILSHKKSPAHVRVWVPACSTGEEAYSIAMVLLEYLEEKAQDCHIQIFATDVDEEAIQVARRGIYPLNIALDVSPERLHRFFVKRDEGYQISRRVRDQVVFSLHNVGKDSPFSRIDLVSCRNLLIYLQPSLQATVLRHLHYALNPDGFLLLGTSETVGDSSHLFSLADAKSKLYTRKNVPQARPIDLGHGYVTPPLPPTVQPGGRLRPIVNMAALAERKVLDLYGPPGVVINENFDVVHFRGRISPFLAPASGAASLNILRLARPELLVDLRRAIQEAHSENKQVTVASKLREDGGTRAFKLDVMPIVDPQSQAKCLLVLFHEPDAAAPTVAAPAPGPPLSQQEDRILDLERELVLTKEYLQDTIEQLEGANEGMQSSNEELQSSNEELQSTNEELETSKEELQSANEELTTVNEELQNRMAELQQANDDLHNVLSGVENAVVISGLDMRIRRFTNAAARLFDLHTADVGRPLSHLATFLGGVRPDQLAEKVIDTLNPVEQEIRCADHRWYCLRISPYKTLEHAIQGTVMVVTDIDVRMRSLVLGQDVADYAARSLAAIRNPLLILDEGMRVVWANQHFYQSFRVVPEETVGNLLTQIGGQQWADPKLTNAILGTGATGAPFRDLPIRQVSADHGERSVKVSGSRLPPLGDQSTLVLLSVEQS